MILEGKSVGLVYTGDFPRKTVRKYCLFSREFRDAPVQVGYMSGLMPIFKQIICVRHAYQSIFCTNRENRAR